MTDKGQARRVALHVVAVSLSRAKSNTMQVSYSSMVSVQKLRVCVEIIWWCMCSMFIDDHSELNFRGIIIKGCLGGVVRTYLARVCGVEGSCSSRKKIEAVAKRSDARTLGAIMSSRIIAELR